MGNDSRGNAKFEFVGISSEGNIATYHTKSGKDFWEKVNNGEFIKNINPVMWGKQQMTKMKIISLDETDNIIIQIGNRKFEAMLSMALYFSDHVVGKIISRKYID